VQAGLGSMLVNDNIFNGLQDFATSQRAHARYLFCFEQTALVNDVHKYGCSKG
jgi:hypothetical protein